MNLFAPLTSVRARLTLWNVGVLAVALLALGGVIRVSVERNLTASVDRDLRNAARKHQEWHTRFWQDERAGRFNGPPPDRGRGRGGPGRAGRGGPGGNRQQDRWRVRFFDARGKIVFPPGDDTPWDNRAFRQAQMGQEIFSLGNVDGERVRLLTTPIYNEKRLERISQQSYSLADVDRAVRNLDRSLLTLTPVALIVAAAGGMLLTGRMLQPVRQVTHAAARIGAEDLSQRLEVRGRDEFSQLASTFNGMLARLESAFEQQRRFTADASHELRTPLTVIKANSSLALSDPELDAGQKRAWEATDRAASFMNAVVQDLLLLARSDAGQLDLRLRSIPLRQPVDDALEAVLMPEGVIVLNAVPDDLMVFGESVHLTRLFVNLFKNAARHTPAGGRVTVTASSLGGAVAVAVEDTGVGIPLEHLAHVTERFYRVDAARSRGEGGTGLGLAICKSIAEAHGGSLVVDSEVGQGTTVTLTLRPA